MSRRNEDHYANGWARLPYGQDGSYVEELFEILRAGCQALGIRTPNWVVSFDAYYQIERVSRGIDDRIMDRRAAAKRHHHVTPKCVRDMRAAPPLQNHLKNWGIASLAFGPSQVGPKSGPSRAQVGPTPERENLDNQPEMAQVGPKSGPSRATRVEGVDPRSQITDPDQWAESDLTKKAKPVSTVKTASGNEYVVVVHDDGTKVLHLIEPVDDQDEATSTQAADPKPDGLPETDATIADEVTEIESAAKVKLREDFAEAKKSWREHVQPRVEERAKVAVSEHAGIRMGEGKGLGGMLTARLRESGLNNVLLVLRWYGYSEHVDPNGWDKPEYLRRAAYLRQRGTDLSTLLRPQKFPQYLDYAKTWDRARRQAEAAKAMRQASGYDDDEHTVLMPESAGRL